MLHDSVYLKQPGEANPQTQSRLKVAKSGGMGGWRAAADGRGVSSQGDEMF